MRLTLTEAVERYGAIENGIWPDEAKWCVVFQVPDPISQVLINSATGKPTSHIYINRDVAPILEKAFELVEARGLVYALHSFDGCLMIRSVRGYPNDPSTHSYACALDLNAGTNRLGEVPQIDPRLVECFKESGFSWGGEFKRCDGQHFSSAWE